MRTQRTGYATALVTTGLTAGGLTPFKPMTTLPMTVQLRLHPCEHCSQRTSSNMASLPKKRKAISLDVKLKIIDERHQGTKVSSVVKRYGLSQSTVSTILKSEDKLRKEASGDTTSSKRKRRTRVRVGRRCSVQVVCRRAQPQHSHQRTYRIDRYM